MSNEELAKVKVLKEINKKIKRKNIIIAIISALSVALISFGFYWFNSPREVAIKYDKNRFIISEGTAINGETGEEINQLFIKVKNTKGVGYSHSRVLKSEDNDEEAILYFYITETINGTKRQEATYGLSLIDKVYSPDGNGATMNISKIYYLIADYYEAFNEEEFEKIKKDAILIWER